MKKTLTIATALILTVGASSAHAGAVFGRTDCGRWLNQPSNTQKAWLLGYMSGINYVLADASKHYDPLDKVASADQLYVWMDNYCRKNPLASVSDGAGQLWDELERKR